MKKLLALVLAIAMIMTCSLAMADRLADIQAAGSISKSSEEMEEAVQALVMLGFGAQQAKKAMETDNVFLNLVTSIGTDVAAGQLEQADLRVALFLPHQVRMARVPAKPGTHTVKVLATNSNGSAVKEYTYTVHVKAGGKSVIVVPAIR